MKRKKYLQSFFIALAAAAIGLFALAPSAWAGVGSGTLTVTNDGLCSGTGFSDFDDPNHWDVFQGEIVHLSINASFKVCTSGPSQFLGKICTTNSNCGTPQSPGTCSTSNALECSGATTVFVKGTSGVPCSTVDQSTGDADCAAAAVNDPSLTTCALNEGFCKFVDQISATSDGDSIDVCYTTRGDQCLTATVAYCSIGNEANSILQQQTQVAIATDLRAVSLTPQTCVAGVCSTDGLSCTVDSDCEQDTPISTCGQPLIPDCTNTPGSLCCSLTQGAYGAPNSVATAAGSTGDCSGTGLGFIPAAICAGDDPFNGGTAPNGTTIGIPDGTKKSVTVLDLQTLIAYLPASGTANTLSATTGDKQYSGGTITPPTNNVSGAAPKETGAAC
jgi:hypothetical protein